MTDTKGQNKGEPANSPEKPDGSKYEARVREIAEEMAAATPQRGHPTTHMILKVYAERFYPAARIAVKHMADAVCYTVIGKMTMEQTVALLKRRRLVAMNAEYDVQKACLTPEAYSKLKQSDQPEGTGM